MEEEGEVEEEEVREGVEGGGGYQGRRWRFQHPIASPHSSWPLAQ